MRKFYDVEIGATGGAPIQELFEKISGDTPPDNEGEYSTNFGVLSFREGSFWQKGGKQEYKTTIEWWLKPYKP